MTALPALAVGCDGCRAEKPYTPFGVTSALPIATASAPPAASASLAGDADAPPVRKAVLAPPAAKRWNVAGRDLDSPTGRVFEQALVADFDGDQQPDAAAWTLPDAEAKDAAPGELWLYPSTGEAKKLLDFPSFLPTGANCNAVAALSASAAATLTLDVRVACSTQLAGRAATRALLAIDPQAENPVRFGVRAAESAPNETLTLELVARDDDSDGRNDFDLRVGMGRVGAAPEVFATLQFLDRAAGVSRNPSQPSRSLLEGLKKDLARSLKKKTAELALSHVELTRRLLGSLCAEGATARVFDWSGNPLPCTPLQEVVDRLGAVEVGAHLALGDFTAALAALARDGWYFGSLGKATRTQLEKDIDKRVPSRAVTKVAIEVRPRSTASPARAPIAFDADGALLIQTAQGMLQVKPGELRAEAALDPDAGAASWPNDVSVQSGERWLATTYSCDRSEVSLLLTGGAQAVAPLALLAPRPGVCGGGRFSERFAPVPAGLEPSFEVVVGAQPFKIGAASRGFPHGVARSPDGATLAIATPLGLSIQAESVELWKAEGFVAAGVEACAVSNRATRAACIRAGKVELYVRIDSASNAPR